VSQGTGRQTYNNTEERGEEIEYLRERERVKEIDIVKRENLKFMYNKSNKPKHIQNYLFFSTLTIKKANSC